METESTGTPAPAGAGSHGLIARVRGILLTPNQEWETIAAEDTSPAKLYTTYVVWLAAIPAVASFIGFALIGIPVPILGHLRIDIGRSILFAVVNYVVALGAVYALGLIIDAVAPSFGGEKNPRQALKVAVYSMTPAWVGGIFYIYWPIRIIAALIALYSLYLLYLGVPALMKAPREKALPYTIVVIVAAIILWIVIGVLAHAIAFSGTLGAGLGYF